MCAESLSATRLVAASSCGAERASARVTTSPGPYRARMSASRWLDGHPLPVGSGGHVAVDQRVGQVPGRGLELAGEFAGEASFFGFDDGAGVVGYEATEHGVGVLGIAQVPGAVQGVEPGVGQAGRVADVVQMAAATRRSAFLPRTGPRVRAVPATPWTCAQRRGSGSSRSERAMSCALAVSVMPFDASQPVPDGHGRAGPSSDVLKTSSMIARTLAWDWSLLAAARGAYGWLARSGLRPARGLGKLFIWSASSSGVAAVSAVSRGARNSGYAR